jgi:hypothetical protein
MKSNTAQQFRAVIKDESRRGHGDKLSRRAENAIVALLAHPTMPEAARAAGISQTTSQDGVSVGTIS